MGNNKIYINVNSEVDKLKAVLMHYPGAEVENMTPRNAQRALYSDILNLSIAQKEYDQIYGVLNKTSTVYTVSELLTEVLKDSLSKHSLVNQICKYEHAERYYDFLMDLPADKLSKILIEGLPIHINTLTDFLRDEYYALKPLYNFYFTRDASVTIGNNAVVCKMANNVRLRESLIMNAIHRSGLFFDTNVIDMNSLSQNNPEIMVEGGDILVAREDILLIGSGSRTSAQAIDQLVDTLCTDESKTKHIIIQQLPESPESFIHLDMVFTFLDHDKAMVYKPLIMNNSRYQTVHMQIENGKVRKISSVNGIISALKKLGMDIKPIVCGGNTDDWDQEREQWHSGANFLAFAPGKVLSYARNVHTLDELSKNGFEIVSANDIIEGNYDLESSDKCVVTIEGSELPRGGGGPRCMTMPLLRE